MATRTHWKDYLAQNPGMTFNQLMTPGTAQKVYFNPDEFGYSESLDEGLQQDDAGRYYKDYEQGGDSGSTYRFVGDRDDFLSRLWGPSGELGHQWADHSNKDTNYELYGLQDLSSGKPSGDWGVKVKSGKKVGTLMNMRQDPETGQYYFDDPHSQTMWDTNKEQRMRNLAIASVLSAGAGGIAGAAGMAANTAATAAQVKAALDAAQAAYGLYSGIKNKNLVQGALGAMGATGALGNLGMLGDYSKAATTAANYGRMGLGAYGAVKSGDPYAIASAGLGALGQLGYLDPQTAQLGSQGARLARMFGGQQGGSRQPQDRQVPPQIRQMIAALPPERQQQLRMMLQQGG